MKHAEGGLMRDIFHEKYYGKLAIMNLCDFLSSSRNSFTELLHGTPSRNSFTELLHGLLVLLSFCFVSSRVPGESGLVARGETVSSRSSKMMETGTVLKTVLISSQRLVIMANEILASFIPFLFINCMNCCRVVFIKNPSIAMVVE